MANKTYLFIDTSQRQSLKLALLEVGRIVNEIELTDQKKQTENILKQVDKLFKKEKIKIQDLAGIIVIKGPGSFVGLRVGISLANTLGYALKIPVVGILEKDFNKIIVQLKNLFKKQFNKIILPEYGQELNLKIKKIT